MESTSGAGEHFLEYRSLSSADNIRTQLERLMRHYKLELNNTDYEEQSLLRQHQKIACLWFFMQAAKRRSGGKGYITVKDNQDVLIHPSTVIGHGAEWVIYNEFVLTSKNYIRTVTPVRPEWLLKLAPAYFNDLDHFQKGDVKMSLERVQRRLDMAKDMKSEKDKKENSGGREKRVKSKK